MIRAFDWRDLPLLHRMRNRGLCLDAELAYTRGPNALQHALLDALNPGRTACTLVARPASQPDGKPSVGQYFYRADEATARLAFISPEEALDAPEGDMLLEALARSAGERGAHNLIAEVDERSQAFESLRRAGFAIYARQRICRLPARPAAEDGAAPERPPHGPPGTPDAVWRLELSSDELAIRSLYLNLVPPLVQQVEPPPRHSPRSLVHWRQGELLGYLHIERGPLGTWIQPYFHPAEDEPDRLLAGFLAQLEERRTRPLYVCVRSYQSWMSAALDGLGFEPSCDQAVMVKRLAAGVRQLAPSALPALEGSMVKPSVPLAHAENHETVVRPR